MTITEYKGVKTLNIIDLIKRSKLSGNKGRRARKILDILKFDNFACTKCYNTNNLTIHHLYKTGKNYTPACYKIRQCVTLCVDCHVKIHYNNKPENILWKFKQGKEGVYRVWKDQGEEVATICNPESGQ